MTPYDKRFEIFKLATELARQEFQSKYDYCMQLSKKRENVDCPEFPTYEQIAEIAEKIYGFVVS